MPEKLKNILSKRLTLILLIFGLAYTWPVYNKYWAPYDEGIVAVAAQMLAAGEVPYRDFFIIAYPPGQIYLLAGLFKIFAGSLVAGRIYAVFVSVAIAMLVYFSSRRLTRSLKISVFAYLVMLASLAPRLGAIPAPIWTGVGLALFAIYLCIRYLDSDTPRFIYIAASGMIAGIGIAFRHDIGIFAAAAILAPLTLKAFKERSFKAVPVFFAGIILVTALWVGYFARLGALSDMRDSLFIFPFVHEKMAAISLPKPCFDLGMIFHQSLYFINVNQFYIPVIAYTFIAGLLFIRLLKGELFRQENMALLAIALFGVITYKEVAVRADPAHLLAMIAPAVIISAYITHDAFSRKFKIRTDIIVKYVFAIALSFLFLLLMIKNVDKCIKNGYTKVYKKDIIRTPFDKGAIYVPREEMEELLDTVRFIRQNTGPGERIYLGNLPHWKDDFGGTLLLYYLADRLPSTKYYELMPGLVTSKKFQEEVAGSLVAKDVRLLILQDVDTGGLKKEDVPTDSLILDEFIARNYAPVAKFGKYNIYKRKK